MFTGIIRHTGKVSNIKTEGGGKRFTIDAPTPILDHIEKGITSVAVNGACHTAEDINSSGFVTFSSFETLKRTTMGDLSKGATVNLELPLTPTTLMDGHLVQGHVDGIGRLSGVTRKGESYLYRFTSDDDMAKYLVEKDSITIEGISLTIFNISGISFEVAVIPETIANTSLSGKKHGDKVNLEVNIFAKYAFEFSARRHGAPSSKLEEWIKQQK